MNRAPELEAILRASPRLMNVLETARRLVPVHGRPVPFDEAS